MVQDPISSSAILRRIWQHYIPTKISFFIWKLLHGAIPTDNAVKKCNIALASRCACCQSPSEESCSHLFLKGNLAKSVWLHFNSLFSIPTP
ncbi:hypothetical protein FRX31_014407, partial [Thalictrum thalictroides]